MASVRLTKQDKRDFANHMAKKLFDGKINELKEEIEGCGEEVTTLLASPEQIKAAALLPDFMVYRRKSFQIGVVVQNPGYLGRTIILVKLPQLTPIPMHEYGAQPMSWEISDKELNGEIWPTWLRPEGKTFCLNKLFPRLSAIKALAQEKAAFNAELSRRLEQVNTLNKLKEASPELHDKWVEYYGASVNTPLALRFDDILKTMHKHQEAA